MRLLSPQEVTDEKGREFDAQIRKGILLQKSLEERERKLKAFQQDYTPEKQRIQKEFDQFVQSIIQKKSELLRELATLETRREIALEPLDNIRKGIAEKEDELVIIKRQVGAERAVITQKAEELLRTQREADIVKKDLFEWSANLNVLNKELSKRDAEVKKQETDVSFCKKEFEETQSIKLKELEEKERLIAEREQVAEIKIEEVKKQWVELEKERKHLYSQQADLRLAFEEARKKNLL